MVAFLLLVSTARAETAAVLVERMKRAWDGLSSYRTGQMIQERVRGTLGPEQRIRVAFRKPWEIQLEWETVHPGRKVYWSAARHGGEVQVYPGGIPGRALGVLSFSIDNGILKRDTNYTPAAAGFGFLVETIAKSFAMTANRPEATAPVPRTVRGEQAWAVSISRITHDRYATAEIVVSQATGLPFAFSAWDAAGQLAERYEWYDTTIGAALVNEVDFSVGYQ